MDLQEIGVFPVLFSEATHIAQAKVGNCDVLVPCASVGDARLYKNRIEKHFNAKAPKPIAPILA